MATLRFGPIPQLPDHWWTSPPASDPQTVWTVWDRDTYYLWGANAGNYRGIDLGLSLQGGGMAGPSGPTRGRAHPHYVGVVTMSTTDRVLNDAVFQQLAASIGAGKNVMIPTFRGAWSLGTGIGKGIPGWAEIQLDLLRQVHALGQVASAIEIPPDTYWPDWRPGHDGEHHSLASLADIAQLIQRLSAE